MRTALALLAAFVAAIVLFFAAVYVASEWGEVVTLRTADENGVRHGTRLWVVDYAGTEWVRTGHPDKKWFRRAVANPEVVLERGGEEVERWAVAIRDPELKRRINEAFEEKYGLADWIVALSGDASRRVPLRLDPVHPRGGLDGRAPKRAR